MNQGGHQLHQVELHPQELLFTWLIGVLHLLDEVQIVQVKDSNSWRQLLDSNIGPL
jgi:hypothetical protein